MNTSYMNELLSSIKHIGRMSSDIKELYGLILQALLYKFMYEFLFPGKIKYSLSEINTQIKSTWDFDILEKAFSNAKEVLKNETTSDYFDDVFYFYPLENKREQQVVIDTLDVLQKYTIQDIDIDELIDCYKVLGLKTSVRTSAIVSTPLCICKLVAGLLKNNEGKALTISDHLCDNGALAIQVGLKNDVKKYYLQNGDLSGVRWTKINYYLHSRQVEDCTIKHDDVLYEDMFQDMKFDIVVSLQKYGLCPSSDLVNRGRCARYSLQDEEKGELRYLENILDHMNSTTGQAIYICGRKLLHSSDYAYVTVRKQLITENIIDSIIMLPPGTLYHTSLESFVLLLKKDKTSTDVAFIDATMYFNHVGLYNTITDEKIAELLRIAENRNDIQDICCVVSIDEIINKEFNLSIEKYLKWRKLQGLLKEEELIELSTVATVVRPQQIDGQAKHLSLESATYPIKYECLIDGEKTSLIIKKGDIILRRGSINSIYLVDENPAVDIVASKNDLVIRPTFIQPEYLYQLFRSEIGSLLFEILSPGLRSSRLVSKGAMERLEIPLPKKSHDEYRRIFEIENHYNINISSYNKLLAEKKYITNTCVEDILSQEILDKVKKYKKDTLTRLLADDIKELNICYRAGAHKAALILAGSILEAVLIDWLSEIDGKDYFKESYYCSVKNRRTGKVEKKRADLIDYIDAIQEIERPNWVDEANMAHTIRKKRNLVHAKLCLSADVIDDATCKMVINYLKKVIETRGYIDR